MKVQFDHHVFSWQRFGGVSKYFVELISHLRQQQVICNLPYLVTRNHYVGSITKAYLRPPDIKGSYYVVELLNRLNAVRSLKRSEYDLFHPTSTNNYFLHAIRKKPFVLTAHDLTIEMYPAYFKAGEFASRTVKERRLAYAQASRIIAISEKTKADLIAFYDIDPGKVDVVYHGYARDLYGDEAVKDFGIDDGSYVLYVGSRKEYKNFDNFLLACEPLMNEGIVVVCAGGGKLTTTEREKIAKLGMDERVFQFDVTNRELDSLYSKALAFVYPSLYEGFGMPILEAFANGCVVALSGIQVFKEIASTAAVYFDQEDAGSIHSAIRGLMISADRRGELRAKGLERVKQFSWNDTAKKTINTYHRAL